MKNKFDEKMGQQLFLIKKIWCGQKVVHQIKKWNFIKNPIGEKPTKETFFYLASH